MSDPLDLCVQNSIGQQGEKSTLIEENLNYFKYKMKKAVPLFGTVGLGN